MTRNNNRLTKASEEEDVDRWWCVEWGGALYPRDLQSGRMMTDGVTYDDSLYHHGCMVWFGSWRMVIWLVVANEWF